MLIFSFSQVTFSVFKEKKKLISISMCRWFQHSCLLVLSLFPLELLPCLLPEMYVQPWPKCLQFTSSSTYSWFGISFYQVVEIVDRYETECIPLEKRNDTVNYIQTPGDKPCNRTITVSLWMQFSSMLLLFVIRGIFLQ